MACIPSNYEINIARRTTVNFQNSQPGIRHFGRLELGDVSESVALATYEEVQARFPASEGWRLILSRISCSGKFIAQQEETEIHTGEAQ